MWCIFKTLSVEYGLYYIVIIKELKSTRSSWKMKLIVGVVFEYDNDDKKVETQMLKTDSD